MFKEPQQEKIPTEALYIKSLSNFLHTHRTFIWFEKQIILIRILNIFLSQNSD